MVLIETGLDFHPRGAAGSVIANGLTIITVRQPSKDSDLSGFRETTYRTIGEDDVSDARMSGLQSGVAAEWPARLARILQRGIL